MKPSVLNRPIPSEPVVGPWNPRDPIGNVAFALIIIAILTLVAGAIGSRAFRHSDTPACITPARLAQ